MSVLARDWSLGRAARHALDHHVAAELAGQDDQACGRAGRAVPGPESTARSAGRSLLHLHRGRVAVLVRVPVQERDVFRRHFDEARPGLGQPAGQQAAEPEAAGVVFVVALLRLLASDRRHRAPANQQPMGVLDRPQHRFLVIVAGQLAQRALLDQFLVTCCRFSNRSGVIPFGGRTDRGRIRRIGQVERPELGAEEAAGGEGLQFFRLADPFEPLADVDERRNRRVLRAQNAGDPRSRGAGRPRFAAERSRCASDTDAASAGCCPDRPRRASGSACRDP